MPKAFTKKTFSEMYIYIYLFIVIIYLYITILLFVSHKKAFNTSYLYICNYFC